ncbi:hypothetical protein Tco_0134571 [Tanacetum coccineum]
MELLQGATPIYEGSCRLTFLERQEVWNDCRSYKVRVGSNGNLLWEASVFLGRKKVETLKFAAMPFGLTNAPAVFMELMSRGFEASSTIWGKAKCSCESLDLKKSEAKNEFGLTLTIQLDQERDVGGIDKTSNQRNAVNMGMLVLGPNEYEKVMESGYLVRTRFDLHLEEMISNRWLSMKKDVASCDSKYLPYSRVEVEYQGSSRLLLQPELPE